MGGARRTTSWESRPGWSKSHSAGIDSFVRAHPRTAGLSRDFLGPKLEPFLEPGAFGTWNREAMLFEKL